MVRIVANVVVDLTEMRGLFFVNENGVIDVECRKIGKVSDKHFSARQRRLQFSVRLFLILDAVTEKHSEVADARVSRPAKSDVFLQNPSARFAQRAQICVARKNDALVCRQCILPRMSACDVANAARELFVIERRTTSIKAREFVKLQNRAAHHETTPRISFLLVFGRVIGADMDATAICKHSRIREGERVAIESKIRAARARGREQCGR